MFETYPFRVGLMGMLTSQYLTVYAVNVVYFLMTAFIYGYRVVRCFSDRYTGYHPAFKKSGGTDLRILPRLHCGLIRNKYLFFRVSESLE